MCFVQPSTFAQIAWLLHPPIPGLSSPLSCSLHFRQTPRPRQAGLQSEYAQHSVYQPQTPERRSRLLPLLEHTRFLGEMVRPAVAARLFAKICAEPTSCPTRQGMNKEEHGVRTGNQENREQSCGNLIVSLNVLCFQRVPHTQTKIDHGNFRLNTVYALQRRAHVCLMLPTTSNIFLHAHIQFALGAPSPTSYFLVCCGTGRLEHKFVPSQNRW